MDSTTLFAKLIVIFILFVELRIIHMMYATYVSEIMVYIGNGSAVDSMGSIVRRLEATEDNGTGDFKFLITSGYRPKDKTLLKYLAALHVGKAQIAFGDNYACGGAIISKRIILTLASCVSEQNKVYSRRDIHVVTGTPKRLQKGETTQIFEVEKIRKHEKYNYDAMVNDIAVITLSQDIKIDGRSSDIIKLPDEKPVPGTKCTTMGWGSMVEEGGPLPDEAIWADLTIKSKSFCEKYDPVVNGTFCVKNDENFEVDTCAGDSGSPLICNNKLVGIVFSQVNGCGNKDSFAVFTDVYYFREWIGEIGEIGETGENDTITITIIANDEGLGKNGCCAGARSLLVFSHLVVAVIAVIHNHLVIS